MISLNLGSGVSSFLIETTIHMVAKLASIAPAKIIGNVMSTSVAERAEMSIEGAGYAE